MINKLSKSTIKSITTNESLKRFSVLMTQVGITALMYKVIVTLYPALVETINKAMMCGGL